MKIEENTDKKLYSPPDFYILDFKDTKSGDFEGTAEDADYNTHYESGYV